MTTRRPLVLLNGIEAELPVNDFLGGDAWQTWLPGWTNLTPGNGTVVAKYWQEAKLVVCRVSLVFGSTTTISGDVLISLPVTSILYAGTPNVTSFGRARYYDVSAGATFELDVQNSTTGTASLRIFNAAGTYLTVSLFSATVPVVAAVGDEIAAQFFYQAA